LNKSQVISSKYKKLVYHHIRKKYGLSAQLAIRAITKTCEAYKLNKNKQPKFKKYDAITYDDRILTFKGLSGKFPQVSLTTLDGRRIYDIHIRNYFAGRVNRVKRQTDLVYQNGKFYLYATCDMPEDTPLETDDFLGVDLGEVNIAVDSTGKIFSNDKVEKVQLKYQK
jgi:transposase